MINKPRNEHMKFEYKVEVTQLIISPTKPHFYDSKSQSTLGQDKSQKHFAVKSSISNFVFNRLLKFVKLLNLTQKIHLISAIEEDENRESF
jgi:hypothetical protein